MWVQILQVFSYKFMCKFESPAVKLKQEKYLNQSYTNLYNQHENIFVLPHVI